MLEPQELCRMRCAALRTDIPNLLVAVVLLCLSLFLICGCGESPSPVIATVGEREMTAADWIWECGLGAAGEGNPRPADSRAVLDRMIERAVLAIEGERRGYDHLPAIQRQLAWIEEEQLLLETYRREVGDPNAGNPEEGDYYQELRDGAGVEVRADGLAELALLASSRGRGDEGVEVVTFRDTTWAAGELLERLRMSRPSGSVPMDEAVLSDLVEREIDRALLVERAAELGIDSEETFLRTLRRERDQLIAERVLEAEIGSGRDPSLPELREYFAAHREKYEREEEVRASIIVVESMSEAAALLDSLARGEDFERLAREHSIDPSGPRGGDLGYFARGRFEHIEEVAFRLSRGEVSEAFAVDGGVAIMKVTARTPGRQLTFDEARRTVERDLREELRAARIASFVAELRQGVDVSIDEELVARYEQQMAEVIDEPEEK